MKTALPPGYKYYRAMLYTKREGYGPLDVITNNTVNSTPVVQEYAHNQHPDAGFMTAEVMWVESDGEPPAHLVEDIWSQHEANQRERSPAATA
jgi:hypothetical protein